MQNTKKLFSKYDSEISEQTVKEIETNLKLFFEILLDWQQKKEGSD